MAKYDYLIVTTKRNISEADHAEILRSYGKQGYRLLKEKKHLFGGITYTLERTLEAPRVESSPRPPIANLNPQNLLIVPSKYTYEVTEVLVKGMEASKESLPLEVKKLLVEWISLNRYDLKEKFES